MRSPPGGSRRNASEDGRESPGIAQCHANGRADAFSGQRGVGRGHLVAGLIVSGWLFGALPTAFPTRIVDFACANSLPLCVNASRRTGGRLTTRKPVSPDAVVSRRLQVVVGRSLRSTSPLVDDGVNQSCIAALGGAFDGGDQRRRERSMPPAGRVVYRVALLIVVGWTSAIGRACGHAERVVRRRMGGRSTVILARSSVGPQAAEGACRRVSGSVHPSPAIPNNDHHRQYTKREQLSIKVSWYYRHTEVPETVYHSLVQERHTEHSNQDASDSELQYIKDPKIRCRELFISDAADFYNVSTLR
uniref:BAH domain-containing protein n=1 Tax=Plectus sambesii TaxID=2011161 RepID=A0A914UQ71_9BILA